MEDIDFNKISAQLNEYKLDDKDDVEKIIGFGPKADKAKKALYEGTKDSLVKRKNFIVALEKKIIELPSCPDLNNPETITLKKLLGSELIKLFKKAKIEEFNSTNFRNAVFAESTKSYAGPKWSKRLFMWIGGPSSSGKSAGLANAMKEVVNKKLSFKEMAFENPEQSNNYVVSVDGGIERELSQMNQLVLQIAIKKGFKGIIDLHPESKLEKVKEKMTEIIFNTSSKIKKNIKAAVLATDHLNMVIPNTFTSDNATGTTERDMRKFDAIPNSLQVFAEVFTEEKTVKRLGDSRAWFNKKNENTNDTIKLNNRKIGCESKAYDPKSYQKGKKASKVAKELYEKNSKDQVFIDINNDLIFVKVKNNKLTVCDPNDCDGSIKRITRRDLDDWRNSIKEDVNLETQSWLDNRVKVNELNPKKPIIRLNDFYSKPLKASNFNPELKKLSTNIGFNPIASSVQENKLKSIIEEHNFSVKDLPHKQIRYERKPLTNSCNLESQSVESLAKVAAKAIILMPQAKIQLKANNEYEAHEFIRIYLATANHSKLNNIDSLKIGERLYLKEELAAFKLKSLEMIKDPMALSKGFLSFSSHNNPTTFKENKFEHPNNAYRSPSRDGG
ncbi:MAG: hypothetical protein JWM09_345 [Francisellaceae bacterium]|nr:hypothetical protein [Francisellaceae bacterium]